MKEDILSLLEEYARLYESEMREWDEPPKPLTGERLWEFYVARRNLQSTLNKINQLRMRNWIDYATYGHRKIYAEYLRRKRVT